MAAGHRLRAVENPASNPILQWNEAFIGWVKAQTPTPALTARNLALLHLALWRTAADASQKGLPPASLTGALNAAGHEICLALFPAQRGQIDALHAQAKEAAGPVPPEADLTPAARQISRAVLESRASDGCSTTIHYVPGTGTGQWRRTPPAFRPPELPHWGKVTPFLLCSSDQICPPPPPAPDSAAFAAELNEVRDLGGSEAGKRTAGETEIARFWSDFSYTTSPPGHWNDIARNLARERLDLMKTARLFAQLNVAMADTGIACWACKYRYNFWRPVTALQSLGDSGWKSLLPSPPHPEYVSGHSSFSGAAVAVLETAFGTADLPFTAFSDTLKTVSRSFRNLHDCALEISRSRVFGGIHFGTSCREGLVLGRQVGKWSVKNFDRL